MTNLRVLFLILVVFGASGALPDTVVSDDTLPPDVVARVGGRDLTFDGLCLASAQQKLPLLKHGGSNATTILRGLVEEKIVELEATRLGISVSTTDVQGRFDQLERDVRQKYRGQKRLRDLMREEGTNEVEFRDAIRNQLRKDKVAAHPSHLGDTLPKGAANAGARLIQVEIVISKIVANADKVFYVPIVGRLFKKMTLELEQRPDPSWIATVQIAGVPVEPISIRDFGKALLLRLSTGDVHEILDREVKTGLLTMQGYKLSDAQFDAEIEMQRQHWAVQRTLTSQEALSEISYDEWIKAQYKMTIDEMKRKRYWRGYLALVHTMRGQITDAEVREEYEKKKVSHWGEYILVTEIQIEFRPDNSRFARPGLRTQRDANRIARDVPRELAAGVPFEQVVRRINATRDPTFRAQMRRLRPNTDDALLWERAFVMNDKDLSSPFETLTHVHLLRREKLHPAPDFATVAPVVREGLSRRKAREWLKEQIDDEAKVVIRWPLPQRGEIKGLKPK